MALTQELKKSLENMGEKWIQLIISFYKNNPKTKETCKEISDFVDQLLETRFSNWNKLDK